MIDLPKGVAQNIGRFTGRAWLLPQILNWWDKSDDRLFLLTGGPGTGKSMVLAWLAGFGPLPLEADARIRLERLRGAVKAAYFCQSTGLNTPRLFAESVATQLTNKVGGYREALKSILEDRVQIVSNVQAKTAAAGSTIIGVDVKLSLGTVGDEFGFDQAFVQPLRKLYENSHTEPVLLLVDALDEAETYTGVTLPDLLSRPSDLPPGVRILATTRDEPEVLKFFRAVKPFDLIKDADRDLDDVRTYAEGRLKGLSGGKDFAQRLATQADGVFLYAAIVLDEVFKRRPAELPNLDSYPLPKGLHGLYQEFLTRQLGKVRQRWVDDYRPLLGLIAVAQGEGLAASQLASIAKRGPDEVGETLRQCKQFLTGELPNGPFRPFHKSFADFLLEDEGNADYHIDSQTTHERIVAFYRAKAGSRVTVDWNKMDAYGLLHLAGHLYALSSDSTYRRQLYEFVNRPVVLAKWQRFGSFESLASDLRITMNVAVQEEPPDWIDFMRSYLLERTFDSFELSADVIRFIASNAGQNGQLKGARRVIDQALGRASNIKESAEKAKALSTIATFLFQVGLAEDANKIMERAIQEAELIKHKQDKSETLSWLVLDMARVRDPESAKDLGRRALAIAKSTHFSWAKAISISSVACALSRIGEEKLAREAFSEAENAAWHVDDPDDRAYALCAVGAAMEQAGDESSQILFRDAWSQAFGIYGELEDEFKGIYVDYRAKSSADPDSLFAMALEIQNRGQRHQALRRLGERMAKMVLYGNYPRQSGGKLDIDRLCDRATFLSVASEEANLPIESTFTLRGLCKAILHVEVN
jgi:tetratricopeptide (TPR) repeat protein